MGVRRRQPAGARLGRVAGLPDRPRSQRQRRPRVSRSGVSQADAELHGWVNRKDAEGRNVFQGGFLGLDNIGIFDRSAPLPTGGHIDQADGTAWMAMYSLNLMSIALVLAEDNHVYEDVATKFFEHFLYIAQAMTNIGDSGIGLWDEADQFY